METSYSQSHAERKIRYVYDITMEIEEILNKVCDDYLVDEYDQRGKLTSDMKETLFDKLDGTPLKNGQVIDLGTEYGTPAMKKLVKMARKYLQEA